MVITERENTVRDPTAVFCSKFDVPAATCAWLYACIASYKVLPYDAANTAPAAAAVVSAAAAAATPAPAARRAPSGGGKALKRQSSRPTPVADQENAENTETPAIESLKRRSSRGADAASTRKRAAPQAPSERIVVEIDD